MVILQRTDIQDDVVKTNLTVSHLGTDKMSATVEKNLLHNFNYYIDYSKIVFEKKLIIDSNNKIVEDKENGETVTLTVAEDKILIDENLNINFKVNVKNVKKTTNTHFNTVQKMAQAMVTVFNLCIHEELANQLDEMRKQNIVFESDDEYIV